MFLFYDFEVFAYDWLVVIYDMQAKNKYTIVNDVEKLEKVYEAHRFDIWIGFNSRHYDQYILKGILCGFNPKEINDYLIIDKKQGWEFSPALRKINFINYDVMPNPPIGLKTLEGFMGNNIKETSVPFNIDRPLTQSEIDETISYCTHDVEQTIQVFIHRKADFEALLSIVTMFNLPLRYIGYTEAQITAKVLGCQRSNFNDEFDYYVLSCIKLNKYKYVQDWFISHRDLMKENTLHKELDYELIQKFYKSSFTTTVAGIPHTFGFGGLHGAADKPVHKKGLILHVDVNNYYPSMLIAHNLVTRARNNENYTLVYNTRKALKYKQTHATTKAEAKMYKKQQLPYKKMLNALSGAMKDARNPAYDPRNNNIMCINGQLMLLDLIEKLEVIPGFELIQSNTDGLIIQIPDTDEAFNMVDDVCYEWEMRCSTDKCSILLELDTISEIYQKDVNNYLWIDADGGVERIGAYLKELSSIDYDLPIINQALVAYMVDKIPIEQTVNNCKELSAFQKIVKLSENYKWVEHEHGGMSTYTVGVKKIKTFYKYKNTLKYTYKAYRVFASNDLQDGRILKCGGKTGTKTKFGNTPDHCFILNDDINNMTCPAKLDRQWYIDEAKKRLKAFGVII